MNRRLLLVALVIVMIGVAAALLRGVAREALIIPLLSLLWGMVDLFESLPQFLVWIILIVIVIVMVVRSVADPPTLRWRMRAEESLGGRVAAWTRVVSLAKRDGYSRWRLAQRLALLATELIADREGVDLRQARQIIESGANLPPEVCTYLRAGMKAYRPDGRGVLAILQRGNPNDPLALDPAIAVAAIKRIAPHP
ncbi:MAG: hypothetical protein SH847_17620 [Roseiflexaceae bacterium]|nr:hypothetical protein [Roseiflexaceae bacterium]